MRQRRRTGSDDLVFNPKRVLRAWTGSHDDKAFGAQLAELVKYTGNPAHKRHPGDFGLTPPTAPRQNATLCDEAEIFTRAEASTLLRAGALKGLVDARLSDEFPFLIWAVRKDGVVFEAQLENRHRGEYHGYPMPLADPLRPEVLKAAFAR